MLDLKRHILLMNQIFGWEEDIGAHPIRYNSYRTFLLRVCFVLHAYATHSMVRALHDIDLLVGPNRLHNIERYVKVDPEFRYFASHVHTLSQAMHLLDEGLHGRLDPRINSDDGERGMAFKAFWKFMRMLMLRDPM